MKDLNKSCLEEYIGETVGKTRLRDKRVKIYRQHIKQTEH